jgi:hypothetical protein
MRKKPMQRQVQLQGGAAARLNGVAFGAAEREKRPQLECAQLARQLPHAQVRRLPAFHRAAPIGGRVTIRPQESEQQVNQNQSLAEPPPHQHSISNRHLLH